MSGFDAELYLRELGERQVVDGDRVDAHGSWWGPLGEAASALLISGCVDPALVDAILDDYAFATALYGDGTAAMRGYRRLAHRRRARQRQSGRPARPYRPAPTAMVGVSAWSGLEPRRVAATTGTVARSYGDISIRWVTLSPGGVRITVTIAVHPGAAWNGAPDAVRLRCSSGRRAVAHFRGGGDGGRVGGVFETDDSLALDATWIEVDGTRIELGPPPAPPSVSIEQLPRNSAALAYLWQRLASCDEQSANPAAIAAASRALAAAGALDPDSSELAAIDWVCRARENHDLPASVRGRAVAGRAPVGVPRAWRSLIDGAPSERSGSGPIGIVPVAAVTPSVDGVRVAVDLIESGPYGFTVYADTTGLDTMHYGAGVDQAPFAFWARDDRGGHYRGVWRRATGSGDHRSGEVVFGPLDRSAAQLTLMPTGLFERALIPIPLRWAR